MTDTHIDRTGHEKWLILCPAITSKTLLHLNIQGDRYALRDFTGHLTGGEYPSGRGQSFRPRDVDGQEITVTADFKRNFPFEWKVDVYDHGLPVTKADRWKDIIERYNLRFGILA